MENWRETLLSQYANSPTLLALIESFNDAQDPQPLIDEFYTKVWNIETAEGYGLDVWGRIVGVSRVIALDETLYLGFETILNQYGNFGRGVFYSGPKQTTNYRLSDVAYRNLILLKALVNITDTTAPILNRLLSKLYSGKRVYCLDMGGMTVRVVAEFFLTAYERAILTQSGIFPRSTGVRLDFMEVVPSRRFGFRTPGLSYAPLGHGSFYGGIVRAI